jgi:hypothetical protein
MIKSSKCRSCGASGSVAMPLDISTGNSIHSLQHLYQAATLVLCMHYLEDTAIVPDSHCSALAESCISLTLPTLGQKTRRSTYPG